MANFCTKCGNPIQFCTCQTVNQPQQFTNPVYDPHSPNPYPGAPTPNPAPAPAPKNDNGSIVKVNLSSDMLVPIKNFFGFDESEMIDNSDPYERGKKIVPDLVAPCEGEIPVKQYEIGKCRARLRLQWSEARMQVTNKRVLFRVSGRSAIGKDVSSHDYKIDEISGVNFSKGIQFSLLTFVLGCFILFLATGLGVGLGLIPVLGDILMFLLFFASIAMPFVSKIFFRKKLHIVCGMVSSLSIGMAGGVLVECYNDFLTTVSIIVMSTCVIISLYQLIKFSLKPSASIEIITKDSAKSVFGLFSGRIFKGNVGLDEIVPAKDTDEAFKEMSAIISDIQQLGDFGVQKWKEKN